MNDVDKSYQQRVIDERRELVSKIEKLEAFRGLGSYRNLPRAERDRLTAQLLFMRGYSAMLLARIESFT